MWPKLYNTIGFLLILGVAMALATRKQKRFSKNIRAMNTGIIDYLFAMATLLLSFIEFWFLTRIFPYTVIVGLDEKWSRKLAQLPETHMGSQHVDTFLRGNRVIRDVPVFNAEECQWPEEFDPNEIVDLQLHSNPTTGG